MWLPCHWQILVPLDSVEECARGRCKHKLSTRHGDESKLCPEALLPAAPHIAELSPFPDEGARQGRRAANTRLRIPL